MIGINSIHYDMPGLVPIFLLNILSSICCFLYGRAHPETHLLHSTIMESARPFMKV